MLQLVLASASPRRRELLSRAGLSLVVRPADVDESSLEDEAPDLLARRLAAKKARTIASQGGAHAGGSSSQPILAADTIVVARDGKAGPVLGKPTDLKHARHMLERLGGRTHDVVTAFHLIYEGRERGRLVTTEVTFRPLSQSDIEGYLASGEWEGKAGGYAIQGLAAAFVRTVRGSYTNVVGLPLCEVLEDLVAIGALPADWAARRGTTE